MINVFFAVLDWGLGHAARSIPVIRSLQAHNCNVIIGSSGTALSFLKSELPEVTTINLSAYEPHYSRNGLTPLSLLLQTPKFFRAIRNERRQTSDVVRHHEIHFIISDNRYGCWSPEIPAIIISHQLNLYMPGGYQWLSGPINRINHRLLKKFVSCWVPDVVNGLTGSLSTSNGLNVEYLGYLSRFDGIVLPPVKKEYEVVAILSGPEPQRTILENLLIEQLIDLNLKAVLVRGIPGMNSVKPMGNLEVINFLNAMDLATYIKRANVVITRPGHSSIMDLATLEACAIFIPTPGQTEQEYLAERMKNKKLALCIAQRHFNLKQALTEVVSFSPLKAPKNKMDNTVRKAIETFMKLTFEPTADKGNHD